MSDKLTHAMRRVLDNLANGRSHAAGCFGRSKFGGLTNTMLALRRRGFIAYTVNSVVATQAGLDALARKDTP